MQTRSQTNVVKKMRPFGYAKYTPETKQNILQKKSNNDHKLRRSKRIANMPRAVYVFDFQFDFEEKPVEYENITTTTNMNIKKHHYNTRSMQKL